LPIVKTTGVSQIFVVDPLKTLVKRQNNTVAITFTGERIRLLAGQETRYSIASTTVIMRTFPHTHLNPYGIAVINFSDLQDVQK
jgi:hypothetical protein